MKAIIIEDEDKIRLGMVKLCQLYLPELEICAAVGSLEEGINAIKNQHPDVVFLDINLNGKSGFDLLKAFPNPNFHLIFATAHAEYALEAIKKEAVDYLLKPIDPEDLIHAVNKVKKRISTLENPNKDKLILKDAESIKAIPFEEILYLEASGAYTKVHTISETHLSSKNLKQFEIFLAQLPFLRVHHSFLVHMRHFERYDKSMNVIHLNNCQKPISVSSRMRENLYEFLRYGLI